MSNQSLRQAAVREVTSTAYPYEGDWHALFDLSNIASGEYNERLLAWLNQSLSAEYTNVNDAQAAYAEAAGVTSWNELGDLWIAKNTIAGNRNTIMTNQSNGLNRYLGVSRVVTNGPATGRGLVVRLTNWFVNGSGVETNTGNSITVTGAIELNGTRYQLKWGGNTSITLADGEPYVDSDPLEDGSGNLVVFSPFAQYKRRLWVDCGVGGRCPYGAACKASLGDEFEIGGAVTDKTMSGTWATSGYFLSFDAAVTYFQETLGSIRDVVMLGDSIGYGWNVIDETGTSTLKDGDAYGNEGPLQRYFNAYLKRPLFSLARPSDRAAYQDTGGALVKRLAVSTGLGTDLVVQTGSNDFYAASATVAGLKTSVESLITKMPRDNVGVVTIPPRTTGTWTTEAGQTVSNSAMNVRRLAWGDTVLSLGVTGQTYAIDLSAATDDGGSKWKVDGGAYTDDGIHFTENGAAKAALYMYNNPVVYTDYIAETLNLLGRSTTTQTTTRKQVINAAMETLKDSGVFSSLDALYVFAANDEPIALLNWVGNTYAASVVAAPTFTTDRGYVFNGTTQAVSTGFNPTTAVSPQYVLNSASMGVWVNDQASNMRAGNDTARIGLNSTPVAYSRSNDATTTQSTALASSTRLIAFDRSSASNYQYYFNGVADGTISVASTALFNGNFEVGRATAVYGTNGARAYYFGKTLTAAQHAAIYSALNTYLSAVGAV